MSLLSSAVCWLQHAPGFLSCRLAFTAVPPSTPPDPHPQPPDASFPKRVFQSQVKESENGGMPQCLILTNPLPEPSLSYRLKV